MNVYDFDNTILKGDSTARFFAYCLLRTPRMWLDIPAQIGNGVLFLLHIRKKKVFKQRMLRFMQFLPDADATISNFWDKNLPRVKTWYRRNHQSGDIVISASPEFLIRPACERLGITRVIASPIDKSTGKYFGENCHGKEKVRAFRAQYGSVTPDEFYSDSYSDTPMAEISRKAYLVKGEKLLEWGKDH